MGTPPGSGFPERPDSRGRCAASGNGCGESGWRACAPAFLWFILTVIFTALAGAGSMALAQDAGGVMASGDAAVSGFSGTVDDGGQPVIDTDGAALKILDLKGHGAAQAQLYNAPVKLEIPASSIGQVFGVALDNARPPNIYVTATSAYGLHIVAPDASGALKPVKNGQAGAAFMNGQFGPGGGPGSVWKIDGKTGAVTLFADLKNNGAANGGAGLGNIVFDPAHYQLFVSDLDSGLIHRLDMTGNELDTFDHGQNGRPAEGLAAVADDGSTADITNPAFDSDNSDTWGLTDIRRQVWGMAFYKGRLYYAVGEGPQIWSVGFNKDGSFAGDAQIEIQQVPGGFPVSDILFTPRGRMILAQRGGLLGGADFTKFHTPGNNAVLRYSRDASGQWTPQADEYAIGFPPDHKNASGGVALSCEGVLWSTGDNLRNDPAAAATGETVVHGLQGNDLPLVRPRNAPPWAAWFIDYDGKFGDDQNAGHVGDVEIARNCGSGRDIGWSEPGWDMEESWPGWLPPTGWVPPTGWNPPPWWPSTPDLDLVKSDTQCTADPANPGQFLCTFTMTVTNTGAAPYSGFLNVTDNVPAAAQFVPPPGGSIAWNCAQPGGAGTAVNCTSAAPVMLVPGASVTLDITIRLLIAPNAPQVHNCSVVDDPVNPFNNTDCGDGFAPGPNLEMRKTLNSCIPAFNGGAVCTYWLDVTNTGTAPYNGWLHVSDTLPAGSTYLGVAASSNPAWGCGWPGGGTVDCYLWASPLNPGATEWVAISVFIPEGSPPGLQNCAALGQPEHAGDPDINGDNSDCAPVVAPVQGPVVPFMGNINLCPPGWSPQVKGWQPPKGWEGKTITKNGQTITCGRRKPERPHRAFCPKGWTRYPTQASVPRGWSVQTVGSGNAAIICAKPGRRPPPPPPPLTGPQCPPGEQSFLSTRRIPRGWRRHLVRRNGRAIWCAAPGRPQAEPPRCAPGEQTFTSPNRIPRGWPRRRVSRGGVSIWCAVPRRAEPLVCPPGERRFVNPRRIPRGWPRHRVSDGQRSIWCARPVHPPRCTGGRYFNGEVCVCKQGLRWNGKRCVPVRPRCTGGRYFNGEICVCKRGLRWNGRRCVPVRPHCTGGRYFNGEVCVCKRGLRWNGRRCVPVRPHCTGGRYFNGKACVCRPGLRWNGKRCAPAVRPCPPRTRRLHGRCVPIVIEQPPVHCPRGMRRVGRRCVSVRRPGGEIGTPSRPPARGPVIRLPKRPKIMAPGKLRVICPRGQRYYRGRCITSIR